MLLDILLRTWRSVQVQNPTNTKSKECCLSYDLIWSDGTRKLELKISFY